jgi:hypothetical protein
MINPVRPCDEATRVIVRLSCLAVMTGLVPAIHAVAPRANAEDNTATAAEASFRRNSLCGG